MSLAKKYLHGLLLAFFLLMSGFFVGQATVNAQSTIEDIYPTYLETEGFNSEEYYLQPIKGLVGSNRDVKTIRDDLIYQGYESYCASPEVVIDLQVDSPSSVQNFLDQYSGVTLELDSTYILDLNQGLVPLARDTNRSMFLTSSIEEYFGFKDVYGDDPGTAEVNSAPINSLLSQSQRCQQTAKLLLAQEEMCDRLADPSSCALYSRGIPETNYTVKQLLDDYKDFAQEYGSVGDTQTLKLACEALPDSGEDDLRVAMQNSPLHLDRAYRVAFLVAAIERRPLVPNVLFSFFSGGNAGVAPKHDVMALAFKVPDVMTNKGTPDNSTGAVFWEDSLMLTRNSLVPRELNISSDPSNPGYQQQALEQRQEWSAQADSAGSSVIDCAGGPNCGSDEMIKALVDIINTQNPDCSNLQPEQWKVIGEPANLTPPQTGDSTRTYLNEFGTDMVAKLFDGLGGGIDSNSLIEKSILDLNNNSWANRGNSANIKFYLVYPVGFEYQKSIEALSGSFMTGEQLAKGEAEATTDFLEVRRDQSNFNPGSVTHEFETDCRIIIDPVTGLPREVCGVDQFTFSTLQQGAKESVKVLGARLGYWMRTIQKSLNRYASGPYAILTACTTTEDFLLGTCGNNLLPPGSVPTEPLSTIAECRLNEGYGAITSGETATHVYIPGTQCTQFDPAIHDIPAWKNGSDPGKPCNDDLYSFAACTFPDTLIANPVDPATGQFDVNGSMTACEYVVSEAQKAGVSPVLALAMWGEESGFSHYKVPDFGVVSAPAQDLGAQVSLFLGTVNSYPNYQSFLEAYGVGQGNQYCVNPYFVGRLKTFYDFLK